MKVLLSWLKDYVDIDVTPQELEKKFSVPASRLRELNILVRISRRFM